MANGFSTRREVVERALEELGATAAGQAPAPEDVEIVDGHVEPVIAMLQSKGVGQAIDPNEFADEILIPISVVLAYAAKGKFGVNAGSPDDPTSFAYRYMEAMSDLRAVLSTQPSYAPAEVEYF